MTSLRLLWFYLAELFSGRLTRRVRRLEMELERMEQHHDRWAQAHMRLEGFTMSKTQALTREMGGVKLSVHNLAVRLSDSQRPVPMEVAFGEEGEEETSILDGTQDSKT